MNQVLNRLKWMVVLVLLQALILNHMHVNGYAVPYLYIYFLLKFHSRTSRNELMLWGFSIGLMVDMFSNTPGMNAAAATCLAFFRTSFLRMVTLRDVDDDFEPGIRSLGFSAFFKYALLSVSLFCVVYLLVDTFSFFHLSVLLLKILAGIQTTMISIFCVELMGGEKR